jgi:hypothetical protein
LDQAVTIRKTSFIIGVFALSLATVSPASANVGVPMLAVVWPVAWVLFVPIVLVEAWIAARILALGWRRCVSMALKANAFSTLIGIPVTWGALFLVQLVTGGGWSVGLDTPLKKVLAVTWQSPWLGPNEGELWWMGPSAAMVLCVPFFFMSVWLENRVARRSFNKDEWAGVMRWAWIANGVSYGLILLWPLCYMLCYDV